MTATSFTAGPGRWRRIVFFFFFPSSSSFAPDFGSKSDQITLLCACSLLQGTTHYPSVPLVNAGRNWGANSVSNTSEVRDILHRAARAVCFVYLDKTTAVVGTTSLVGVGRCDCGWKLGRNGQACWQLRCSSRSLLPD